MRIFLAAVLIVVSSVVLEMARHDVEITQFDLGQTPVTRYARPDSDGPAVVVAHGFAGSQQMMQGYALPLARAGYRVFVFEFLGHGQNVLPMSGDLTSVAGTTRLLVDQTTAVIGAVAPAGQPVALLGHSMATDILVRAAAGRRDVGPIVLISAFSQAVDATSPQTLLLISGEWEPRLRAFGLQALQMVAQNAEEGETVTAGPVTRRSIAAPWSEHVSVLQSRTGRAEALGWLDKAYGRDSDVTILPTGWAILGLLLGIVMMFRGVARCLPARHAPTGRLGVRQIAALTLLPVCIAPLVAVPLNFGMLPVLVADYLVVHLMVFGMVQLVLCRMLGLQSGGFSAIAFGVVLLWCALFGFALDRYAANFWPTTARFWIIMAMALGAVPYMVADMMLAQRTSWLGRLALRGSFLLSLGIAVALDFERLFFLMMIAPVLVLFYLVFGTIGGSAAGRSGALSTGLALGLVLAWAIGVSFPLFQP